MDIKKFILAAVIAVMVVFSSFAVANDSISSWHQRLFNLIYVSFSLVSDDIEVIECAEVSDECDGIFYLHFPNAVLYNGTHTMFVTYDGVSGFISRQTQHEKKEKVLAHILHKVKVHGRGVLPFLTKKEKAFMSRVAVSILLLDGMRITSITIE